MKVVQSPSKASIHGHGPSVFLAGGIRGCPDWQENFIRMAGPYAPTVTFVNPRRARALRDRDFEAQVRWEHDRLLQVDAVSFWFPWETLCPITLYELGTWTSHRIRKPIFIGAHPEYARRRDVVLQTNLVRCVSGGVHRRLEDLVVAVCRWAECRAENDAMHLRIAKALDEADRRRRSR